MELLEMQLGNINEGNDNKNIATKQLSRVGASECKNPISLKRIYY